MFLVKLSWVNEHGFLKVGFLGCVVGFADHTPQKIIFLSALRQENVEALGL